MKIQALFLEKHLDKGCTDDIMNYSLIITKEGNKNELQNRFN